MSCFIRWSFKQHLGSKSNALSIIPPRIERRERREEREGERERVSFDGLSSSTSVRKATPSPSFPLVSREEKEEKRKRERERERIEREREKREKRERERREREKREREERACVCLFCLFFGLSLSLASRQPRQYVAHMVSQTAVSGVHAESAGHLLFGQREREIEI
jgi:hypothetical protein